MNSLWYQKTGYPVGFIPIELGNAVYAVCAMTKAPVELVAPVVLASAAAAVQGVSDVQKPCSGFEDRMPTSMFFGVVAPSGGRKTSVLNQATAMFEEFEQGLLSGTPQEDPDFAVVAHQFLLDKATEPGVVDVLRGGAKSLLFAVDEGAAFFRGLDLVAWCKRFDGATIRHNTRKEGSVIVKDTRASTCMLTQGATFDRIMKQKGQDLMESGLLPRMLMSFCTDPFPQGMLMAPTHSPDVLMAPFNDRVRSLLSQYALGLRNHEGKRLLLTLSPQAANLWSSFANDMEYRCAPQPVWHDVRAFVMRAAEHALRLSAVFHSFSSDGPQIAEHCVDAACRVVAWHLQQAKVAFGEPPQEVKAQQLANAAYEYLCRTPRAPGPRRFTRSELLRFGPKEIRNADNLSVALERLMYEGKIQLSRQRNGRETIDLVTQYPLPVPYQMDRRIPLWN
ncbi:DUF3987 domain-containing protein [Acidovorax sp.]|uniref:DUF3987 domain-containing protein n=1 Tax=Acidovorax sp. TaxID=1872122 RepID=UPI0026872E1C|nr:DUF3987 domain-containing protein [Acidovorax sp.]